MPNTNVTTPSMMSILATPDTDAIRHEDFKGVDHLVVPVIMLQEQVLWPANAESPELALAEEFGRFPESWDGRPVVLNHPKRNGLAVSANAPDILTERSFGQVFNTYLDGDQLKAELWINTETAESLGEEFTRQLERLESGEEIVEVSTGLFMQAEPVKGMHKGQEFNSIWRNIVPDHLAILPEGIVGACSVEGGCGAPRVNENAMRALEAAGTPVQAMVLTPNASSQEGAMACECGQSDPAKCNCESGSHQSQGMFQAMMQKFGNLFSFQSLRSQSSGLSDRDRRMAIESALSMESGDDSFFWIVAVFDDTFVYEEGFSDTLLERGFEISESGAVTLDEEKVRVRPMTQFVPVETSNSTTINAEGGPQMTVDEIIASTTNGFTEEDREYLEGLDESILGKLVVEGQEAPSTEAPSTPQEPAATDPEAHEEEAVATNSQHNPPKTLSVADFISQAPSEIQEVLSEGLRMQSARRAELIKGITNNERNQYTEQELKDMSLAQLEKTASLALGPNYEGAGAVRTQAATEEDDGAAPPMPTLFEVKK